MNFHLIMFGPQGSGKGTQAEVIAQKYALGHISTGAIFREEIKKQTERGKALADLLASGGLVPDDITNAIVEEKIKEYTSQNIGFILDGYPRTLTQAESLAAIRIDHVFLLDIPDDVALERLQLRFQNASADEKRADDKDTAAIEKRLSLYHEVTKPLITYYETAGLLRRIDGTRSIPEVTAQIETVLNQ